MDLPDFRATKSPVEVVEREVISAHRDLMKLEAQWSRCDEALIRRTSVEHFNSEEFVNYLEDFAEYKFEKIAGLQKKVKQFREILLKEAGRGTLDVSLVPALSSPMPAIRSPLRSATTVIFPSSKMNWSSSAKLRPVTASVVPPVADLSPSATKNRPSATVMPLYVDSSSYRPHSTSTGVLQKSQEIATSRSTAFKPVGSFVRQALSKHEEPSRVISGQSNERPTRSTSISSTSARGYQRPSRPVSAKHQGARMPSRSSARPASGSSRPKSQFDLPSQ